jgi:hypothetical protein
MSHFPIQKKIDSRSNHPLARELNEASHCNHLNPVFIFSMAITARKRRLVPQERLLTCQIDPRQPPPLQWRNEIRFLGMVNHTRTESLV